MQHVPFIVVGLGIAGTLTSYELWKAGADFIVIDNINDSAKASLVAGAVINPVNLNRWEATSHAEQFIPAALDTYRSMESLLHTTLIEETAMLVFHSQATNGSVQQINKEKHSSFSVAGKKEQEMAARYFKNFESLTIVNPVWKVQAARLIQQWRSFLKEKQMLTDGWFNMEECSFATGYASYKNIQAGKIIFCEGAAALKNTLFSALPFTRNRGEALLVYIPELPEQYIYHNGIRLVPAGNQRFWCGSNYQWQFSDLSPDEKWRADTEARLQNWLQLPFTVEAHIVAERPTTAGQEILMGVHPSIPGIAILNGLGTKGFSAGPFMAKQLCRQLLLQENSNTSTLVKPLSKWLKA